MFINLRYEYTTRECPTDTCFHPEFEAEMLAKGWQRAWADITIDGAFVVYRRQRKVVVGVDPKTPGA